MTRTPIRSKFPFSTVSDLFVIVGFLALFFVSCGTTRMGPKSIDVVVENKSKIKVEQCEIWFGHNNMASIGQRMPGTSFSYGDFPVKELSEVKIIVLFDGDDRIIRRFSVDFLKSAQEERVELVFVVDRESDTVLLRVQSLYAGGNVKLLRTLEGTREDNLESVFR